MTQRLLSTLTVVAILFGASIATAFETRIVPTTPTTGLQVGQVVSFDLYLDTEGDSRLALFSGGLGFDTSGFMYRSDLSDSADFPLYYAGSGMGDPATWLAPGLDPPALWAGSSGPNHVNADFIVNTLSSGIGTTATATNAFLATMTFEAIAPGTYFFDWSHDKDGNVVSQLQTFGGPPFDNVDITDQVTTSGSTFVTVVPEPGTLILLGLGLVGLAGQSRARSN